VRRYPPPCVSVEQPRDDATRLPVESLVVLLVVAALDLSVEVLLADAPEGEGAREHHVEENADGPHVDWLAVVILLAHDLRRHVRWSATKDLQLLGGNDHREPKVNNLDLPTALFYQNIVELNVPMYYINRVEVIYSLYYLFEHSSGCHFSAHSVRFLSHILLHGDSLDVVSQEVHLSRCVDQVVQTDH